MKLQEINKMYLNGEYSVSWQDNLQIEQHKNFGSGYEYAAL